jgi:hypothetical protein
VNRRGGLRRAHGTLHANIDRTINVIEFSLDGKPVNPMGDRVKPASVMLGLN